MKERKERAEEAERLQILAQQAANRKAASITNSSPRSDNNSVLDSPKSQQSAAKDVNKSKMKIFSEDSMLAEK